MWKKIGKENREWASNLIKEKVEVECKVVNCRESGTVIVVKLENEESKKKGYEQ